MHATTARSSADLTDGASCSARNGGGRGGGGQVSGLRITDNVYVRLTGHKRFAVESGAGSMCAARRSTESNVGILGFFAVMASVAVPGVCSFLREKTHMCMIMNSHRWRADTGCATNPTCMPSTTPPRTAPVRVLPRQAN